MPIGQFVAELEAAYKRKDGYIMGATGQDPKKWAVNSWWYNQYRDGDYTESQYQKALYWRDHAARVWDCNGMAEGIYKDFSGVNINTKARFNYARAKQTTVSDVMATNYSMIEGLKDFAKGFKTDNKQANVNTDNNISINLNIDKFVNERKQDVEQLMEEISFISKRKIVLR